MYEKFFGLRARPFDLTCDPRFLVLTRVHQEALSSLDHAFAAAKPLTLLLGEAGTGKTTIIRAAIQKQSQHTHCVHLQNPGLTRNEFVQMVARQFGLSVGARMSKTDLLLEFEQLLRERHDLAQHTVLVVDEAQSLPEELLEELRLLTNIETNNEKPLSLVLAGQPELATLMNEPAWRHLKQRVALRCELRPLDVRETALYIAGRISAFGGLPVQTFTKEAVVLIHQYSRGIPRTINVIADNALLGAFGSDERPVTTRIVHAVCADFDIRRVVPNPADQPDQFAVPHASKALTAREQGLVNAALPLSKRSANEEKKPPQEQDSDTNPKRRAPLFSVFGLRR